MSANTNSEPKRLTRASIIGHAFRIQKTYGVSPIGVRARLRFERAVGCRSILELSDLAGKPDFASLQPITVRTFSTAERTRRERWAREDRAEVAHG
jgi:hypothetical protein